MQNYIKFKTLGKGSINLLSALSHTKILGDSVNLQHATECNFNFLFREVYGRPTA